MQHIYRDLEPEESWGGGGCGSGGRVASSRGVVSGTGKGGESDSRALFPPFRGKLPALSRHSSLPFETLTRASYLSRMLVLKRASIPMHAQGAALGGLACERVPSSLRPPPLDITQKRASEDQQQQQQQQQNSCMYIPGKYHHKTQV